MQGRFERLNFLHVLILENTEKLPRRLVLHQYLSNTYGPGLLMQMRHPIFTFIQRKYTHTQK